LQHPNESLIAQIEEQWRQDNSAAEARAGVSSSAAGGGGTGGASGGAGGGGSSSGSAAPAAPVAASNSASLNALLQRLHQNQLLNFFEFTASRSVLTIYGPSFDCLYFTPHGGAVGGASGAGGGGGGASIYRDRQDYLHTLGHIHTLIFKMVDWQLVALHVPLLRARLNKLKHIILVANHGAQH
jgi:hypothetical protein